MTDYWISQGRKFCEFCKCSIADNKPSIQFHENGKKHKENVAKRLAEMQKKASKEAKDALNFEKELKKIEAAALKAYVNDLKSNGDYTSKLIESGVQSLPCLDSTQQDSKTKLKSIERLADVSTDTSHKSKKENLTNGRQNYRNFEVGEPAGNHLKNNWKKVEFQHKKTSNSLIQRKKKKEKYNLKSATDSKKEIKNLTDDHKEKNLNFNPIDHCHPYGTWKKVETKPDDLIDLQLPRQEFVPIAVPKLRENPEGNFKQKVFKSDTTCSSHEKISFKKRTKTLEHKRNMRQRLNDD